MTVGERLRKARASKGVRQADIAKVLGVTQPRVQQLEKSGRIPSHLIPGVAKAYGVDPLDLLPKKARGAA